MDGQRAMEGQKVSEGVVSPPKGILKIYFPFFPREKASHDRLVQFHLTPEQEAESAVSDGKEYRYQTWERIKMEKRKAKETRQKIWNGCERIEATKEKKWNGVIRPGHGDIYAVFMGWK